MKVSTRFIIAFLLLITIFSTISAFFACHELNTLRSTSNKSISSVVAVIKEKYPNVSNNDIAKIFNNKTNCKNADKIFEEYGINPDYEWIVLSNESVAGTAVTGCVIIAVFSGLALCALFLAYVKHQNRQTKKITEYIAQINKRDYNLLIEENSEDELSSLKNEIYKTTVMLKEQSENSMKDKENLKDSLSDISHQLKTPLTSVMVMLDNIMDDPNMPDDIRIDFLKDIKRETNTISFLVQSILTLSKLDANSIILKSKPEKTSLIIDECIQKTAVLAEIRNIEVIKNCPDSIIFNCDFKWLAEALTNIVKNCIEHTSDGGFVKISAEQNKIYTKIIICDNGCGISQNDIPHIFERFYKGASSSDDSVGIGLALAKTIIEKGNGCITVDSVVGKGSQFTIKYFYS